MVFNTNAKNAKKEGFWISSIISTAVNFFKFYAVFLSITVCYRDMQ